MVQTAEGGVLNGHGPLDLPLDSFFFQACIIILFSRLLSIPLKKINQPTVISEVLGGIMLGPSVFGNIPGFTQTVFPSHSLPFLKTIADLGLTMYLFLVGLELDVLAMLKGAKRSVAISLTGSSLTFSCGIGASFFLYTKMQEKDPDQHPPFTSFLLFTGVAMSVTAFPVLARILTELNLLNTDVGVTTISAAAVDDAMAWSLLALVISIINAKNNLTALYVFLLVLAFALTLVAVVRPLFLRLVDYVDSKNSYLLKQLLLAFTFIMIFVCAWITDLIGVHAIFGAFLFGLIIPPSHHFAIALTEKLEDLVSIVFLPLYFAYSGLNTQINTMNDGDSWLMLLVVFIVAAGGKIIGCSTAAKLSGLKTREAFSVGVLMNTKGLVELIVLNLGLEAQVIDERIFTIMVMMALLTTFITTPLISYIYPPEKRHYLNNQEQKTEVLPSPIQETFAMGSMMKFRVLLGLDKMEDVSSISSLLPLFKSQQDSEDIAIHCIHHKESSELTSNVMYATQTNLAIKVDPVLKMMSVFGHLMEVPVVPHLAFGSHESYIRDMVEISKEENVNLVLVPYKKPSFGHSGGYSDLVKSSVSTLGFYIDATAGHFIHRESAPRKVLVPFIEGQSHREALILAMRFAEHEHIHVHIVVLSKLPKPEVSEDADEFSLPLDGLAEDDKFLIQAAESASKNSRGALALSYLYNVVNYRECILDVMVATDYNMLMMGYYNETNTETSLGSIASGLLDSISKTSILIVKAPNVVVPAANSETTEV